MSLRTRLFFSHSIVIAVSLGILGLALFLVLSDFENRLTRARVGTVAAEVVTAVRRTAVPAPAETPVRLFERVARQAAQRNLRVLWLDDDGSILADSQPLQRESLGLARVDLTRATGSVQDADAVAAGSFRDTLDREWEYVVVRVRPDVFRTDLMAFARLANPTQGTVFDLIEERLLQRIVLAGLAALVLAGVLAALVARSIARPIQQVALGADAIAQGDYGRRVAVAGPREVAELASDFNDMAARVQAAQQRERDFVANVSHELKTPLTSIQGFAQAITDGAVSEPTQTREAARVIFTEADRLKRLVTGLLDSSRLDAGGSALRRTPLNVNTVIAGLLPAFERRAADAGVSLRASYGEVPAILADGDRLAQIMNNLLDNALKHTPARHEVRVETAARRDPRGNRPGVEIAVVDTGRGIPPEDLPRLFERFYQVDKARAQTAPGSVGLGLSIVKQIVEAHQGRVSVTSTLGAGTRMSVWLPAGSVQSEQA